MNLGNRLQDARKAKGLAQEDVASKLFVTRQTVSRWEQNKTLPNVYTLEALSELYELPIEELITSNPRNSINNKNGGNQMKKINYFALFGSIMFNVFLFSGIALTLVVLLLSLWLIIAAFIASPFMLVYVNLAGIQPFTWYNTIFAAVAFLIGLLLVRYAHKLTFVLLDFFKKYYRYNVKNTIQWEDREIV